MEDAKNLYNRYAKRSGSQFDRTPYPQKSRWGLQENNIAFIISDIHTQPLYSQKQPESVKTIGKENIFGTIDDALNKAREILGIPKVDRTAPFVPL